MSDGGQESMTSSPLASSNGQTSPPAESPGSGIWETIRDDDGPPAAMETEGLRRPGYIRENTPLKWAIQTDQEKYIGALGEIPSLITFCGAPTLRTMCHGRTQACESKADEQRPG